MTVGTQLSADAELLNRVCAPSGEGTEVVDAATRAPIGNAPRHTSADLDAAVRRAAAAECRRWPLVR